MTGIAREYARTFPDPETTMVRLLRLVVDHGVEQQAVEHTQAMDMRSVEVVAHHIRESIPLRMDSAPAFAVIPPDLGRYDDLLTGGAAR